MQDDPDYLLHHGVLLMDYSKVRDPNFKFRYKGLDLSTEEISRALYYQLRGRVHQLRGGVHIVKLKDPVIAEYYQLRERVHVVKPKDPVIADLLYLSGLIEAHTNILETAQELFQVSLKYGYSKPEEIHRLMEVYDEKIAAREFKQICKMMLSALPYILFFVLISTIAIRKKWLFLSRRSYEEYLRRESPS